MNKGLLIALGIGLVLLAGGGISEAAAAEATSSRGARVINRWAAAGVHPDMQHLLDLWEQEGWFDVQVGTPFGGFPGGGLRTATDAAGQASACQNGLSNACTLGQTPHGRGGALDIWPVPFNPLQSFDAQPGTREAMIAFGNWAKSHGYVYGGDWPKPDYPHVEMANWTSLPFPPPSYPS